MYHEEKSIDEYAEEGNKLYDEGSFDQAIQIWQEGLDSLDKPLNVQSEDKKYFNLIKNLI